MTEPDDRPGDPSHHLGPEQLDELARAASADQDPDQAPTEDPAVAELHAHLAGCPACRTALGDQVAVQAWLRRVPDVGQMPADVTARLDAALATAAQQVSRSEATQGRPGSVLPMVRPERRTGLLGRLAESRVTKSLVAAAAVGLIAGGGWVAVNRQHSDTVAGSAASDAGGSSGVAAPEDQKAAAASVRASGTAYTSQNLITEVDKQLALASPAYVARSGDGSAGGSADGSGDGSAPGTSPLTSPTGLAGCLAALGAPSATPALVDLATYDGKPAAVIVLPSTGTAKQVWVVSRTCAQGNDGTLFYATLR